MENNKMKKTKSETFEILDNIWDSINHLNIQPETTWNDVVNVCSSENTKDYIKKWSLEKFLFETKYVFRKPNRETMEYLWGDHVSLYHSYGCKIHKFIGKSYDSYDRYIDGLTIFCPECNKEKFQDDKSKEKYIDLLDGKFCSDEEWKEYIRYSKFNNKIIRKENLKYKIKQWSNWHYIQYKFNLFIIKSKKRITK